MRTLGVVTVARSDFGLYRPLLRRIRRDRGLRLHLYAGGSHWWASQGTTGRLIEDEGFVIGTRVRTPEPSDSPGGAARALGDGVAAFGRAFAAFRPDLLVVLGDRFDMCAAALAALPFRLPVAHLHGGELTRGAMDDSLRHAMTKLSHLHFASTREYARRLRQLGEEPWRIRVSGALGLDNLRDLKLLSRRDLEERWGLDLSRPFALATFHPTTLDAEPAEAQVEEFLAGLEASGLPAVFTLPNADPGGRLLARRLRRFAAERPGMRFVETLGTQAYFSLMKAATVMAGNSSSGLLEAPSFGLPVLNVGRRQEGRLRARNVIDVPCRRAAIARGLSRAASPRFRDSLRGLENPYDGGGAAEIILDTLKRVELGERLVVKRFADLPGRA